MGVLVDHLVPGSKESRIAASVAQRTARPGTCSSSGTRSSTSGRRCDRRALGIDAWPTIPRDIEWKKGVCQALGWPHRDQADIARAWQRILGGVRSYADLEPQLLGRVEELIDFVTADN